MSTPDESRLPRRTRLFIVLLLLVVEVVPISVFVLRRHRAATAPPTTTAAPHVGGVSMVGRSLLLPGRRASEPVAIVTHRQAEAVKLLPQVAGELTMAALGPAIAARTALAIPIGTPVQVLEAKRYEQGVVVHVRALEGERRGEELWTFPLFLSPPPSLASGQPTTVEREVRTWAAAHRPSPEWVLTDVRVEASDVVVRWHAPGFDNQSIRGASDALCPGGASPVWDLLTEGGKLRVELLVGGAGRPMLDEVRCTSPSLRS